MRTAALWLVMSCLFSGTGNPRSQGVSIIEIGDLQVTKSLAAVVKDSRGFPMDGVLGEEMSADWKTRLRSTRTDSKGRFSLKTVNGRKIYYLELTYKGFNPLRVRIQVDPQRGVDLQLQMTIST